MGEIIRVGKGEGSQLLDADTDMVLAYVKGGLGVAAEARLVSVGDIRMAFEEATGHPPDEVLQAKARAIQKLLD